MPEHQWTQKLTLTCPPVTHPQTGKTTTHTLGHLYAYAMPKTLELRPSSLTAEADSQGPQRLAWASTGPRALLWFCPACRRAGLRDMRAPRRLALPPLLALLATQRETGPDRLRVSVDPATLSAELDRLEARAPGRKAYARQLHRPHPGRAHTDQPSQLDPAELDLLGPTA